MRSSLCLIVLFAISGCVEKDKTFSEIPSIVTLADLYFSRTIEVYPENTYYTDISLDRHDRISTNLLKEVKKWENFEDSLYGELSKIDVSKLTKQKDKITYWFLNEELESSIALRICNRNLWNIDPESGWQSLWLAVAQIQPIGSDELREQALTRWNNLPDIIENEITNLKLGVSKGYTMPKEIVRIVINQLKILLDYQMEESPFMLPAIRDNNEEFYKQWTELYLEKILPGMIRYQTFLKDEYIPVAREDVAVLALPDGEQCYQAYIRKNTTTNKSGEEIYALGQEIVSKNKIKIEKLGRVLYESDDFGTIINNISMDSSNYFKTGDEIIAVNERLIEKAKEECEKWFISLPRTDVPIKPYESYESGVGAYESSSGDKPAYFRINLNNPGEQQKGSNEVLTFHETYPGHHLQIGLEKEIEGLHPILKFLSFTSYVEGWARYSEQLAEEMGLYESKSALITRRAWPSRGMVVDPGIHIMGWSKSQSIEYMVESGMSSEVALNLYHRSITMPAQLTSYDVGGEEIKALRELASKRIGQEFDIKEFHSKIVGNGAIPLVPLRIIIEEWIEDEVK